MNIEMTTNGFVFEGKEYTFPVDKKQKEEFQDRVNWSYLSQHQKLSEKFIKEFKDKVNWDYIFIFQKLSEKFIRESHDKVIWHWISQYQKLSEKFIKEFQDKVYWGRISEYQKLSEKFIREFQDKVVWHLISQYQKLSEKFIKEFKNKVNWDYISIHQKLSEKFIREFRDKVDWHWISRYQNISEKFRKEFNLCKIGKPISIKEYAQRHHLEIKDGYLYAFRNHDFNGSGIFMKNIYYEKGKKYRDWHCDLNPDHSNSYGLGVFPEGNTAVRVKIEDWGTGVKDSNKGRVWEFEVL